MKHCNIVGCESKEFYDSYRGNLCKYHLKERARENANKARDDTKREINELKQKVQTMKQKNKKLRKKIKTLEA